MRRSSRGIHTRLLKIEREQALADSGVQKYKRRRHSGGVMHIPVMPESVEAWERITAMKQTVLKARAKHEGPEPDDVAFPYPVEVIEHLENAEWEYHA